MVFWVVRVEQSLMIFDVLQVENCEHLFRINVHKAIVLILNLCHVLQLSQLYCSLELSIVTCLNDSCFAGLLITYVALNLMDGHGQPALLYIVPFTLGKWCYPEKGLPWHIQCESLP